MRDLLVTAIVFGGLAFTLSNPHIGVLLWSWIGYMNPHRLGWGFATSFPFALIIGLITLLSLFISRKKLEFFWTPLMTWLLLLNIWFLITTIFSLQPSESWEQWKKVIKIQIFIFITLWVMNDRKKIDLLIWVIVISIGFYGVKGGFFTIMGGGSSHVLGPPGGFISGNTEIGLAMVMVFPLMWYLYLQTTQKWIRYALLVSMLLTIFSILGTQSRGALLAVGAIGFFFWMKSRKKLVPLMIVLIIAPFAFMFMPEQWHNRMQSIKTYEEDSSALGRIQAWNFAYRLASARPIGGGFEAFNASNYETYAPGLVESGTGFYHDVHSIYFEILGEHGYIGLILFLIIGITTWQAGKKIIRITQDSPDNKWGYDLASMIHVSMIGYATGGAFLGLAYFDLPYHLAAIMILVLRIVTKEQAEKLKLEQKLSATVPKASAIPITKSP